MKKIMMVGGLILALVLAVEFHQSLANWAQPPSIPKDPQRIISLAPSVTETLYALGLGSQVVGVTQFCSYPPEVKEKPVVAGFSDINIEAVLRLKPDLVALPVDKLRSREELERLGLATLALDTRSLSGLMEMVRVLGETTGHQKEAREIIGRVSRSMVLARNRAEGRLKPKILFSIMHSYQGLGYITEISAVGKDGFFSELIGIAGGENVYKGELSFPRLSREALIALDPEIIIDVVPKVENLELVRNDWETLSGVKAIQNKRLIFLTDEADTVPGPRVWQTLSRISSAFHPEEKAMEEPDAESL